MDEPTGGGACRTTRATRPVRAATSALTTTIACSVPVFLVGGLAVQIADELHFSPAGLGLAVSVYFGVSALASVPAGGLVERYGATAVARAAIGLAAASLLTVAIAARSLTTLVGDPRARRGRQRRRAARQQHHPGPARARPHGRACRSGSSRPPSRSARCWPARQCPRWR